MKFRIIRQVKEQLTIPEAREAFMDLVEIRQRLFSEQFEKALCLDRHDLISDHLLLYASGQRMPIAYMRSTTSVQCAVAGVPLPIEASIGHLPALMGALRGFRESVELAVNMSYLCLDKSFRAELQGIKLIDLMTWAAFQVARPLPAAVGYCATPNLKFKQTDWLKKLGDPVEGLAPFSHPVIPDPHELVLIPRIREDYWDEREAAYGHLIDEAEWLMPRRAAKLKLVA